METLLNVIDVLRYIPPAFDEVDSTFIVTPLLTVNNYKCPWDYTGTDGSGCTLEATNSYRKPEGTSSQNVIPRRTCFYFGKSRD